MIKRNNPSNIRYSIFNQWIGQVKNEDGYVVFDTLDNGTRAMLKLVSNYISDGRNTIEKIVSKWCPPSECNTENYIQFMSDNMGIPRNQAFAFNEQYRIEDFAHWMSKMESGEHIPQPIVTSEYLKLVGRAYSGTDNQLPTIEVTASDPIYEVIGILLLVIFIIYFTSSKKK